MNFITINTEKIGGALFAEKTGKEISVAKGQKAPVIMTGYIGANEEKDGDGYKPTAFGRLQVEAAKHEDRLVLAISGGLRGVLFKEEKNADKYQYSGVVEDGDTEYPVFGRQVKGERGTFISLSSAEKRAKKDKGTKTASKQAPTPSHDFEDDDVPF